MYKRLKYDKVPNIGLNTLQMQIKEQIEEKIRSKEYNFESVSCPICCSSHTDLIGEKDRYGLYYPTNLCKECGLIYNSPRMDQSSYNAFYNSEYRKLYSGKEGGRSNFFQIQKNKGKKIYNFLQKNNLLNETQLFVLEIGCAAGGILDFFKERGHVVKGVDLGKQYVLYGKEKYNLDLEVGTIQSLELDRKPDLIIYSHVLEHTLDLNEELRSVKEICHSNTIIYIEVPGLKEIHKNYNSDLLIYFQNAHTFHFSLETLKNLFGKHNFDLIAGNQYIRSAFGIKKSNSSNIQNDYHAVKKYLKKVELKRTLLDKILNNKRIIKSIFIKGLRITKTHGFIKTILKK